MPARVRGTQVSKVHGLLDIFRLLEACKPSFWVPAASWRSEIAEFQIGEVFLFLDGLCCPLLLLTSSVFRSLLSQHESALFYGLLTFLSYQISDSAQGPYLSCLLLAPHTPVHNA